VSEPPRLDPDYPAYPTSPGSPTGYPPYPTPVGQPRPRNHTAANWALGLTIVPAGITLVAGVITALVVLCGRDDGTDRGKGKAVGALGVAGGWLAVFALFVVAASLGGAERDEDGRLTASGRSPVLELGVGDCLPEELGSEEETWLVEVAPCEERHFGEVFATWDLEGEWASQARADFLSAAGCADRFADYAGVPLRRTDVEVFYYRPVDERDYRDDPTVICVAGTDARSTSLVDDPPERRERGKARGKGGVEA
jgi:hypothetical protein